MKNEGRLVFWDVVKGVTILLVILGHCLQYSAKGEGVFLNPIFKFIYGFHMPLFALISGYFFYNSVSRHPAKAIIKSRSRQCILPIATITVLTQVAHLSFRPEIVFHNFVTNLWFLWSVFYLSCLVLIIRKLPPPIGRYYSC